MSYKTILTLIIPAALLSCSRQDVMPPTAEERQEVSNQLKDCDDTTAVKQLIKTYEAEGNIFGQEAACQQLGVLLRGASRFSDAIDIHQRGYDLAERAVDTLGMVQHLNNIGTNFRRMGILDEAANYHYRTLTLSMANADTSFTARKNRVISLNGIGNVHLTLGNTDAADSAFRAALCGEHELGSALGQAINYANIGSIFEGKGRIDSARVYY